jgi:hypothetical protein
VILLFLCYKNFFFIPPKERRRKRRGRMREGGAERGVGRWRVEEEEAMKRSGDGVGIKE